MRKLVIVLALVGMLSALPSCSSPPPKQTKAGVVNLEGAGATFPHPLYKQWIAEFNSQHPHIQVSYDSIGSGKGVEKFMQGSVDFGASDGAMTDELISKVSRGVLLVPTTAGMVALAYNPEGLPPQLKLKRDVYVDIFLGKITKWNDPRIKADNPDFKFPEKEIAVVARQDSSGTTFAFTNHLSTVSESWKAGPGAGKVIDWPGKIMRAPGNEGVAGIIQQTPGAIGYVEYGLAKRLGLPMASLENKAGEFIPPVGGHGLAALLDSKVESNFREFLPDPAGQDSYPIITFTWLLIYRKYDNPQKAAAVKEFVKWCLTDGQKDCEALGFVRLPPKLAANVVREIGKLP